METRYVFEWESVGGGSSGFEYSDSPSQLLVRLANRVNAPDDDI